MSAAQNVNGTVQVTHTATEQISYGNAVQNVPNTVTPLFQFTNGTGAVNPNLIDDHFEHTYVLAAGASVTLTLSALTDDLGRSVAFVSIRSLLIYPTVRTAGDYLKIGNAGTHPWVAILDGTTPDLIVFGLLLLVADSTDGYAVTAGTSDQLKITNAGANALTFKLALMGRAS